MNNIVVLISANAEWQAIKQILQGHNLEIQTTPFGETFHLPPAALNIEHATFNLTFLHGGWGKISAAATTQYAIDHLHPNLLINLGTCGGLDGRAAVGDILLIEQTLIYDIIEQMGDEQAALDHYTVKLNLSWLPDRPLPAGIRRAPMLSADRDILREDVEMLVERFNAIAGDWESGAIAWVAAKNNTPCLILRGVTDIVSPQNGEAYENPGLYHQRTQTIMARLLELLPFFLKT